LFNNGTTGTTRKVILLHNYYSKLNLPKSLKIDNFVQEQTLKIYIKRIISVRLKTLNRIYGKTINLGFIAPEFALYQSLLWCIKF